MAPAGFGRAELESALTQPLALAEQVQHPCASKPKASGCTQHRTGAPDNDHRLDDQGCHSESVPHPRAGWGRRGGGRRTAASEAGGVRAGPADLPGCV